MNFTLSVGINIKNFLEETFAEVLTPLKQTNYLISRVITDTRTYKGKGGVFFAIKGKNFDGHTFINNIIDKIDYVIISDKNFIIEKYKHKFIIVRNVITAIDKLAELYRLSFPKLKVIAVVGSNGKTTTKELIKNIFSKKFNTIGTNENQNNLIGTAYTLFSLTKKTQVCVVELGISTPGEMDILGCTVKPDIVIITCIGKEHLEFLGSIENVFVEETKIVQYLKSDGILILNYDDNFLKTLLWRGNKKYFGITNNTILDVYPEKILYTSEFSQISIIVKDALGLKFRLPDIKTKLLGEYNVYNILAAVTCAFYGGVEDFQIIIDTINNFTPVEMRGKRFLINNNLIIDESYNANPDSMRTTISEFIKIFLNKDKILVLGDMLELGQHTVEEHINLKQFINFDKIHSLYLLGQHMKHLYESLSSKEQRKTKYFTDKELLYRELASLLLNNKNLCILFKSSNAVKLSEVVKNLVMLGEKK
ncbi:MAG: UDP-N-acetylmuramoyl-tripeptide--D-alanyl-D-alanine ligase [Endomicrobia bacterium]|nr:UDP-N-acetylmuramoyl-tripeptide--D-alanyl-D-alanine ligase [Endomicrobiia bacterium]MCX7715996.1 UDP-N-acetylmuramoyl-tripeptide--D-alanyl-D-alanine ligase [Endomicrobiia bacterium]